MTTYDIVIIGGGIAGIYTMYSLSIKFPHLKILLLETNKRFGGRVYTYNKHYNGKDYVMDLGAGRIGHHHQLMVKLIKHLDLQDNIINIDNTKCYIEYNNNSKKSIDLSNIKKKASIYLTKLLNSNKMDTFISSSYYMYFSEFLQKIVPKKMLNAIINTFEYKNKLYYLNANDAINYFKYDYNDNSRFFIMKNGMSEIIDTMISKIKQNPNCTIKNLCHVVHIDKQDNSSIYTIEYKNKANKINKNIKINCTNIICALPKQNLINFTILKPYYNILNSINEISKVRIFEIYDTKFENNCWFKDIKKTTTNTQLQFIIPINSSTGLIMSSYCENLSKYTNYWVNISKKGSEYLKRCVNNMLRKVFDKDIPLSNWIKLYYWKNGIACWKTNVDSQYISNLINNLMPNFYICGENYSTYQAWCEGALLTSNTVIDKIALQYSNQKRRNTSQNRREILHQKTRRNRRYIKRN